MSCQKTSSKEKVNCSLLAPMAAGNVHGLMSECCYDIQKQIRHLKLKKCLRTITLNCS